MITAKEALKLGKKREIEVNQKLKSETKRAKQRIADFLSENSLEDYLDRLVQSRAKQRIAFLDVEDYLDHDDRGTNWNTLCDEICLENPTFVAFNDLDACLSEEFIKESKAILDKAGYKIIEPESMAFTWDKELYSIEDLELLQKRFKQLGVINQILGQLKLKQKIARKQKANRKKIEKFAEAILTGNKAKNKADAEAKESQSNKVIQNNNTEDLKNDKTSSIKNEDTKKDDDIAASKEKTA